jgi:nitroreductase
VELHEAMYQRRSIRDYTDQRVTKETVEKLLEAAVQAPSAMNEQPWAFIVIQDKERLHRLSEQAKILCSKALAVGIEKVELQHRLADPAFNIFYNSGTLIVICAKHIGEHPDWDCCLAGQNLLLAAQDRGLGTCPIGLAWPLFEQDDVKTELHIPPGYSAVLPIIVGYPKHPTSQVQRHAPTILSWN